MRRRDLLKAAAVTTAAVAVRPVALVAQEPPAPSASNRATLARRPLGKTGAQLSIVGFPGLLLRVTEADRVQGLVDDAVEKGVNYFDVAPNYGDAEVKLGPALEPYRKRCFLACKTMQRTAEKAKAEFERSLERLRTDRFDLYQLHCLRTPEDVDAVFGPDGAWGYVLEQKKAGRIGLLGFSAHGEEAALAALDRYDFDTMMFPIGFATWFGSKFGPRVFEKARSKGVSIFSMKSLCRQRWTTEDRKTHPHGKMWYQPVTDPREQELAVRWALSQDIIAVLPPHNEALHRRALEVGLACDRPVTAAEIAELQAIAATLTPQFPELPKKAAGRGPGGPTRLARHACPCAGEAEPA